MNPLSFEIIGTKTIGTVKRGSKKTQKKLTVTSTIIPETPKEIIENVEDHIE
jgi:hypothetical protein